MICTNCHNVVPEGSLFCNKCGQKLEQADTLVCPNPACVHIIPKDSKFCPDCGSRIVVSEQIAEEVFYQPFIAPNKMMGYKHRITGEIIIEPRFDVALKFSEGRAAVKLNNRWGYIDVKGDLPIPFIYDGDDTPSPFIGGLARVRSRYKYGYIDVYGKNRIPFEYYGADGNSVAGYSVMSGSNSEDEERWMLPVAERDHNGFFDGLLHVFKGGEHGYIDMNGHEVMPYQYMFATAFSNGVALVIGPNNWQPHFIDVNGKHLFDQKQDPFGHRDICDWGHEFINGFLRIREYRAYGFVDKKGEVVIPPQYTHAGVFFKNGLVIVKSAQDDKCKFIDASGNFVCWTEYDQVEILGYYGEQTLVSCKKNGLYGCLSPEDGSMVLPCISEVEFDHFDDLIRIKQNGKFGYVDQSCNTVLPCAYDDVWEYRRGLGKFRINHTGYYIDIYGNIKQWQE